MLSLGLLSTVEYGSLTVNYGSDIPGSDMAVHNITGLSTVMSSPGSQVLLRVALKCHEHCLGGIENLQK